MKKKKKIKVLKLSHMLIYIFISAIACTLVFGFVVSLIGWGYEGYFGGIGSLPYIFIFIIAAVLTFFLFLALIVKEKYDFQA